ncbi:hypothetical protein AB0K15_38980 [Amycolatopsis sp. NPDC049253]|uniref:hypothetical protein n=1 Tax=Amycolatopsis sp. NPDC049253 TaxID=3155274 RepID=UPI0034342975
MPDPGEGVRIHADVHELLEPPVRTDHPECRVSRADQLVRGVDDPPQQRRESEVTGDHPGRPQKASQAALSADDFLGAFDQLGQQLVQLKPRLVGERQPARVGFVVFAHPGSRCLESPRWMKPRSAQVSAPSGDDVNPAHPDRRSQNCAINK